MEQKNMAKKSLEIDMMEGLFNSFREALAIPSKTDIEALNDKLDRIEKMLLEAASAEKVEPAAEAPVAVEKEETVPVEVKEAAPVEKKKPAPAKKKKPAPAKAKKPAPAKKKKAPGKKKEAASDKVLDVIKNQEEGADFKKIKAETKFDDKKIRNIIFRLHKLGQIEKVRRGVYKAS